MVFSEENRKLVRIKEIEAKSLNYSDPADICICKRQINACMYMCFPRTYIYVCVNVGKV